MPAQAPTYRPTWLVILSSLMLLAGGYSLVAGLMKLRDPATVLMVGASDAAGSEADMELNRQLNLARTTAIGPHRTALKVESVAEIAIALFTLYATAAVFSRDKRGRALSLAVGGLGILYQLSVLPIYLSLTRDYATRGAGLLATSIIRTVGETQSDLTPEQITARLHSAIVSGPIVAAGVGVAGSLLLLVFFGGRRGQILYGLRKPPQTDRRREPREAGQ